MTERFETDVASLAQIDDELENCLAGRAWSADDWLDDRQDETDTAHDQASRLRALVNSGERSAENQNRFRGLVSDPRREDHRRPSAQPEPRRRDAFVITVASGKGGVGKTSMAVNLAVALAEQRWRVSLLDADLGTANADVLCGLNPAARLEHVLTDLPVHDGARRSILDVAVTAPGGFRLIPGASGIARLADLNEHQRSRLLDSMAELERESDIIVVDAAAGVGGMVTTLLNASDLGLIVVTPEPTSIADAYALIKCARSGAGADLWRAPALLVNQAVDHAEAQSVYSRMAAVCHRFLGFRPGLLGWVAHDLRVGEAVRSRRPVLLGAPSTRASRQIRDAAARITQQVAQVRSLPEQPRRARGLLALVRRWRNEPARLCPASVG